MWAYVSCMMWAAVFEAKDFNEIIKQMKVRVLIIMSGFSVMNKVAWKIFAEKI